MNCYGIKLLPVKDTRVLKILKYYFRTCLGTKFATLQSKAVLATLVHNFKITVDSKTKDNPLLLDPNAFLNIKFGELWLNFEAINN